RSRVLERLQLLSKSLPSGTVPTLGPDATGVGHVFWYTVEGKGQSLRDLRSIQDWFIRYQLNAVPGVAEVASIGGFVRQYQIDVDPNRLRAYKISLSTVVDAVMRINRNVGGIVVTIINIIFLLHFRSVLIVTIPLPLAVLTAFLFMRYLGISSNIMSLAGIAIAIGVLVDAGIVVTENAFRFIERRGVNPRNRR